MTESDPLRAGLRAIAIRAEVARRLSPPAGTAVLASIVEATVALFGAEASSIALFDPIEHKLVFTVAAGEHGREVVGLAIDPGEGVAGYVFSTGQPMALAIIGPFKEKDFAGMGGDLSVPAEASTGAAAHAAGTR